MYTYYVSVWIKYISYLHINFLPSQPRHSEPHNSQLKLKTIKQLRAIHYYPAKNKGNAPRINEKLHKISLSWALLPASFCCSTSLETFWTKLSTNGEVDFKAINSSSSTIIIRCKVFFLLIGRKLSTWSAITLVSRGRDPFDGNNESSGDEIAFKSAFKKSALQIMVC